MAVTLTYTQLFTCCAIPEVFSDTREVSETDDDTHTQHEEEENGTSQATGKLHEPLWAVRRDEQFEFVTLQVWFAHPTMDLHMLRASCPCIPSQ
jgi:hypothetical protein